MTEDRVDTIVCGGQVVFPNHVNNVSIAIRGEKIVAIGPEELLPVADRYIDVKGKFVLPGLIDCHVHLDKCDSIGLGSKAVAYSGITTLLPFGTYDVESDADLLVIDPNGDSVVTAMNHHGNSGFSLFEGWNIKGSPWMTLIRGKIVLNQGKLEQKPGYGRWISCESPSMPVGGPIK